MKSSIFVKKFSTLAKYDIASCEREELCINVLLWMMNHML
ncbi:hypothetical protein SAMN04488023_1615 [Pedobacter rhizosphaerae]|uniref:Uncharacterized protein n=1 Tax=Pedobacter rhizosphaerae TaxID=390241 RepID=A0A1H9W788_9SPHI|nr:hypothetical protein SAMN04488023_1615 [Pedobacter rhizosphaerae]